MKVKFSNSIKVEQSEIESVFRSIGCGLSESVKKFFLTFNGAVPETNIFKVGENNESGVNELIPVTKIADEKKYIDHVGEQVFPIALAEGGNYLVMDFAKGGSIYFWDHEEPQNLVFMANDFDAFLSTLEPFDPSSVQLKDGQVESAWIDPDFLKNLS